MLAFHIVLIYPFLLSSWRTSYDIMWLELLPISLYVNKIVWVVTIQSKSFQLSVGGPSYSHPKIVRTVLSLFNVDFLDFKNFHFWKGQAGASSAQLDAYGAIDSTFSPPRQFPGDFVLLIDFVVQRLIDFVALLRGLSPSGRSKPPLPGWHGRARRHWLVPPSQEEGAWSLSC